MQFNGTINYHKDIDWWSYMRDSHQFKHKIILPIDYEADRSYPMIEVIGRFGDDFCEGANPLHIQEYPDKPIVTAEIQLSQDLIKRLEKDGETDQENLNKLKEFYAHV